MIGGLPALEQHRAHHNHNQGEQSNATHNSFDGGVRTKRKAREHNCAAKEADLDTSFIVAENKIFAPPRAAALPISSSSAVAVTGPTARSNGPQAARERSQHGSRRPLALNSDAHMPHRGQRQRLRQSHSQQLPANEDNTGLWPPAADDRFARIDEYRRREARTCALVDIHIRQTALYGLHTRGADSGIGSGSAIPMTPVPRHEETTTADGEQAGTLATDHEFVLTIGSLARAWYVPADDKPDKPRRGTTKGSDDPRRRDSALVNWLDPCKRCHETAQPKDGERGPQPVAILRTADPDNINGESV